MKPPQVMNLPSKGCLLTVSTSHRNIHLFSPGLCSLLCLGESQAQKSGTWSPHPWTHSAWGQNGENYGCCISLFHKIPAIFLLYQCLALYFLLMLQLLLLIKIMNTFLAQIYIICFLFFSIDSLLSIKRRECARHRVGIFINYLFLCNKLPSKWMA